MLHYEILLIPSEEKRFHSTLQDINKIRYLQNCLRKKCDLILNHAINISVPGINNIL